MRKCFHCNKKFLITVTCKCGNNYCLTHRYAENHKCSFDYKAQAKERLEKENPVINYAKIIKI